jgi:hypothetical protein
VTGLIDQLEETIRQHLLAELPSAQTSELADYDLGDLLIVYGTWRSRFVVPRPRKVHFSEELQRSDKCLEHRVALGEIAVRVEAGEVLTPYLSRGTKFAHEPGAEGKKPGSRKDRDLLLAEWGVHHLHLSTEMKPDGFAGRSGDLLFAVFTADDAYFIGIYTHESFAMLEILTTYVRNWPNAGALQQARFAIGLSQHFSDDDRKDLRSAGVTGPVEIDGKVYMPPGQTLTGVPLPVLIQADNFVLGLRKLRELGEHRVLTQLNEDASATRANGEWSAALHDGMFGFASNGVFLRLGDLPWT